MNTQNKQYQQLTQSQRYPLQALHSKGFSQREIALDIEIHHSTVSRELKRNTCGASYCAEAADRLKEKRKAAKPKRCKYDEQHDAMIANGVLLGGSPEKLSLRMKRELPEAAALSHTTLYRRIARDKAQGGKWFKKLPRYGKRRCKGGKRQAGKSLIPDRVDISERPEIVDDRARLGDWEGDTVHGQDATLVTLVERKSRLLLLAKVPNKQSYTVCAARAELLSRAGEVHTLTLDNGGEFARHALVSEATKAEVYFARPYASWQRGTNENTHGLLRRCWPKKMALGALSEQDIRDMELRLNMTPRKVLGGLTPMEVYTGCVLHLLR
jgi:transposase, IS30 family